MGFQITSEVTFVTIGYIEWRKGQDILVDAIAHLPADLSKAAKFILVGQNTSRMARRLEDTITNIENITMPGTISREEVHRLLEQTDMLICPSREDPMPTVCAEAMMHSAPCLVSDATGTAKYMKNGYDGLIFQSGNTEELCEKIAWCIRNRGVLEAMGRRAHEIYRNHFSQDAFENHLLRYVEEMIGKA